MAIGARVRVMVAGFSVAVATASGVVANVVSDRPSMPWWVALGVLTAVGVVSQGVLTLTEGRRRAGTVGAAGSVRVGGTSRAPITTRVQGVAVEGASVDGDVLGPGAVHVDGDSYGRIATNVTGPLRGW